MHIQINDNTSASAVERDQVAAAVTTALGPHRDRITRAEVHLAHDAGSARPPVRCTIEVRPAGDAAVAVTHTAPSCTEAVRGAGQRLRNMVDSWAGRRAAFSRDSVRLARPVEELVAPADPGPARHSDSVS